MKRLNFAWMMVIIMAILAIVIFVNRLHRFFDPRSVIGYSIYGIFILAGLLVVAGLILTILNYNRTRNRAEEAKTNNNNINDPPQDKR